MNINLSLLSPAMRKLSFMALTILIGGLLVLQSLPSAAQGPVKQSPEAKRAALMEAQQNVAPVSEDLVSLSATPCVGGVADGFPCENIDLLSFTPLADIGGSNLNDIWGWTDPNDGHEYALVGRTSGTSFVDITDPENPVYLGNLPGHNGSSSSWRDIKVDGNYAFVVSEAGGHGMQVFDLTRLRNVPSPPTTFTEDAHFAGFGSAHNIVVNEESNYAYGVGTGRGATGTCGGGLHMVDISNPLNPTDAGCFSADGYTHDAQCVNYNGPDADYAGHEICLNSNEDTLTIVDVTNKVNPVQVARVSYPNPGYTHQGWLTEDQRYFLQDDETDEQDQGHNTYTFIWDLLDLDNPQLIGTYDSGIPSSDHNQYIHGNYAYQSNYSGGLRVLDLSDVANGNLEEVGYFDTYPADDNASFNGTWSNYPYFESGSIIVTGRQHGLFVVRTAFDPDFTLDSDPTSVDVCAPDNAQYTILVGQLEDFSNPVILSATGHPAGTNVNFSVNPVTPAEPPATSLLTISNTGAASAGSYNIDVVGNASGAAPHEITVGLNLFDGAPNPPSLMSPANGATDVPAETTFEWAMQNDATSYMLEVATDMAFTNVIYMANEAGTSHTIPNSDALDYDTTYYWRVTAINPCGDGNPSGVRSFTTSDVPDVFCHAANLDIPDGDPAGTSTVMNVGGSGDILDLNISINATHTWVGDLIFTVEHDGTSVTVFDRPGYTGTGFGCSGDDLAVTLDDEATELVEDQCNTVGTPAIDGVYIPNEALSAFDGMELNGDWTITVSDNATQDTGTLDEWCVIPTTTTGGGEEAVVRVGSGSVASGGSLEIPLEALDVPAEGLSAATIDVTYDPSVVTVTGCDADPNSLFDTSLCSIDFAADTIRFTAISTAGVSGDLALANIMFEGSPGGAGDSSPLDVSIDTFTDAGGNPIPAVSEDGLIEIGNAGDVTCDGASNAVDALFILQHVVGTRGAADSCPLPPETLYEPGCDVSGEGTCNTVDALFVLQCVVGIPNSFCPAGNLIPSGSQEGDPVSLNLGGELFFADGVLVGRPL